MSRWVLGVIYKLIIYWLVLFFWQLIRVVEDESGYLVQQFCF